MPEALVEFGCNDTIWKNLPYGAQRDIERFCRIAGSDEEFVPTKEFPISPMELAQNRVETMIDINRFVVKKNKDEDAPFEDLAWNNGVSSWELSNLADKETAIAKAKADKKERNRLLREAAKKAEEAETKAKSESEADSFQ